MGLSPPHRVPCRLSGRLPSLVGPQPFLMTTAMFTQQKSPVETVSCVRAKGSRGSEERGSRWTGLQGQVGAGRSHRQS